ncbi:MAG: outer membrane beta-barrel protein [Chitinophagaceae bacterium]|nr:outer membrane beta-barrel protein [Chitinophagaceae bacterium]
MKKAILFLFFAATGLSLIAQETETGKKKKKDWSKVNLGNRPKDHLMLQIGYLQWLNKPDSIATKGFARSVNAYFSFDFPFKVDPRFSVGLGAGVGADNMFFDKGAKRNLNIINGTAFTFAKHSGRDTANQYKSMKLATVYLEAPVELRFMVDPEHPNKSLKFALGMKVGTIISATDKTKFNADGNGNSAYVLKEKDRKHFNNLRLAATARIGMGNFAIFGQYQLNDFIKEGQGPNQIRPLTFGITLTGL